ncbi:MAG: hypothetical protein WBL54_05050 [Nitrososphaeraceae archaeon]
MSEGNLLHLASAVIMFAAAIIPIYLSLRLKRNLRILTFLLAVFILTHGIYHLAYYFGEEELGEGLFRTISIVVLIIFGISFINVARSRKEKLTV